MNARLLCFFVTLGGTFVVGCGKPPPQAHDPNGGTQLSDRQRRESGVRFEEPNGNAGDQPIAGQRPGGRVLTPAEEDAERKRKQIESEFGLYDTSPSARRPRGAGAPPQTPSTPPAPQYSAEPKMGAARRNDPGMLPEPHGVAMARPRVLPSPLPYNKDEPGSAPPPRQPDRVPPIVQPQSVPPQPPLASVKIGEGNGNVVTGPPAAAVTSDADVMFRRLAKRLKENPQDPSAHLEYQVFQFLSGQSVPQIEMMGGLQPEDREWLIAFLDGLTNLRNGLRAETGSVLISQRIWPLLEMANRMRTQAELRLPTLALCSKVSGFGVYDPMANRFQAGMDHRVIVYCEVENFSSRQSDPQRWETRLSIQVNIYTDTGVSIWNEPAKTLVTDISRKQRHDFFVIKHMTLPKTLGLGKYMLKITVQDEQAQRVAENNLEITMTAQ